MLFSLSYVLLWLLVVVLAVVVLVLAKQVGSLLLRVPRRKARMLNAGPDIGDHIQRVQFADLLGKAVVLPSAAQARTLLVFVAPGCSSCVTLIPSLRALGRTEKGLDIVLAGKGRASLDEHRRFIKLHKLSFPYIDGRELAIKFQVPLTPYALLIGGDGILISKGMVNHLEDLESVLNAGDLSAEDRANWAAQLSTPNSSEEVHHDVL